MIKKSRPLTQREIRQLKKEKNQEEYTMIHNVSRQAINIQLKSPVGIDFLAGEQTVPLFRGKSSQFPKNRLRQEQIVNLQKAGRIKVSEGKVKTQEA